MENKPKTIHELIAEIQRGCENLQKLSEEMNKDSDRIMSAMLGFPVQMFSKPKVEEPTVQELTLSEMMGLPVKIKK